jgi:hypothetical protein
MEYIQFLIHQIILNGQDYQSKLLRQLRLLFRLHKLVKQQQQVELQLIVRLELEQVEKQLIVYFKQQVEKHIVLVLEQQLIVVKCWL